MKSLINRGITASAIIGVIVIIGAVGNIDYLTTVGQDCNMFEVIKTTMIGLLLIVPAIIREVKIYIG